MYTGGVFMFYNRNDKLLHDKLLDDKRCLTCWRIGKERCDWARLVMQEERGGGGGKWAAVALERDP